jgi:hypothetical protein
LEDLFGATVEREDNDGTGVFTYSHKTESGVCVNTFEKVEREPDDGLLNRVGRKLSRK